MNAISFTGSVETGGKVALACARRGAKFQLEMGGKNPLVVLEDANLDAAVAAAVDGAFYQTGQRCTASSRLIVAAPVHDAFVARMVTAMKALKVDHALKEGTQIGPVVDEAQMAQDEKYIAIAREEGGELVWGGERLNRDTKGHYLSPALFTNTHERHAHQPRGSVWSGGLGHQGRRLRRGAGRCQRHAVRPVIRHLHQLAESTQTTSARSPPPAW